MLCTRADDLCGNVTLRGHGFHVRILAFMASDSEIPKNRSCKNPLSAECGAWVGDLLGDCRNEVWMLHRWQGRNRGGRVEQFRQQRFPGVLLKSSKSSCISICISFSFAIFAFLFFFEVSTLCISLRPSARPLTSWMTSPNLRCHLRQKRWSLRICPDSLFVSVETENGKITEKDVKNEWKRCHAAIQNPYEWSE